MEKTKNIILPITILIASIILGGSYYVTQKYIKNENREEREFSKDMLNSCLEEAKEKTKRFTEEFVNVINEEKPKVSTSNIEEIFENISKERENYEDECFKRYPQINLQ